ncbi:30S ribosomal protein S4 [bacterium]|nr:30S ribosomal protein S4 [bacterium]
MARPLGSFHRKCRRVGQPLCGSDKCPSLKRPYPPGQHGFRSARRRLSRYGQQLKEKQKLRFTYGATERQMRNLYREATSQKSNTGQYMFVTLESRLDNICYRLGFARTRPAARQFVVHRHVEVNGKVVNIPSYRLKPGDRVRVRPTSALRPGILEILKTLGATGLVPYITLDPEGVEGRFDRMPVREEIPEEIDEQVIVEFYSR